ncbi:sugar/nucleoside kinase (ribokinase family) [Paenibacillus castaneae]|uniref:carbohydrate kinase family protein n=1 Tax=Paenibacillus castaneae TaxID=474957 RepID=UPI000C9A55BC|nr:carbohydrate kinase [Paenibacillus castaneae]NIK78576.1 sugar/nucleoside kinase (ribokinase family) [Paenibacillus castaneae]
MVYDVTALGEVLVDFTPAGKSENGNQQFECNPGGAPANVLAALAKLGKKTSFIGKVGNDQFGTFLKETLETCEVHTGGLVVSSEVSTTLAFVHLDDMGDRSFSFHRKPGSDQTLHENEVDYSLIDQARIFHFGSISMTHEPSRTATLHALEHAKKSGAWISFDPNLRLSLWDDLTHAKSAIIAGLKYSDITKLSEEELAFITGTKDLEKGSKYISETYGVKLVLITLAEEGCYYRFGQQSGKVPGFRVDTIDTTGAGDAFLGGILFALLEMKVQLEELSKEDVEHAITFANAVGAIVTTKRGAIPAMPGMDEIRKVLNEQ